MAKVTLTTFLTLDGVMQGPGAPDEDTSGGFDLGGWLVPYADEAMARQIAEWFDRADAFLLGRHTYEIFAAFWPHVTDEDDPVVAARLNNLPKYVASTTLDRVSWNNSTLLDGDVPEAVAKLKEQPGREIQIHGSGALARSLMAHDLIDEFRLLTYPVVLGRGRHLFTPEALPTSLCLTASNTTPSGITIHTYELEGRPTFGTM